MRRSIVTAVATACCLGALLNPRVARAADPTTADCLAASDSSLQSGNQHKLRAERSQLLVCAAANCPADIRNECGRRMEEVRGQIPTIVFEAKDTAGNDLSAVRVSMDGEVLAERLEGSALSIDPGEHSFTFEARDQPTLTKSFVIREGQKERRELVSFGGGASAAAAAPTATAPEHPFADPTETPHGLGTQKIAAIAVAGVGLVGLGVGTIFGLEAVSKKNDAAAACPNQCATPAGVQLWSDAKSAGTLSTVGFIVGGVAIAGGAVLWFTAKPPREGAAGTNVGIGPGRVEWRGTF